jgi:DNA sulfur modification protein DndB
VNIYPAIKAHMGDWTYYIVKMRMADVANEVSFSTDVHTEYTLSEAIQRTLNDTRVKQEIVSFITRRSDRFFGSLVVAAIGGKPQFFPVNITDDPRFAMASAAGVDEAFGALTFTGAQKYYALDGQHRLKAIKSLIIPGPGDPILDPPPGFADEEISVLMVIRPEDTADEDWLISYRRLFTSLNRYAKAIGKDSEIIMDEDDAFAILTRKLISDHDFFRAEGREAESLRVQTKGKQLREGQPFVTSLQELYGMNEVLLSSAWRKNSGWGVGEEATLKIAPFKRFRPTEEYLDDLYDELARIWDAAIEVVPDLSNNPSEMKDHAAEGKNGGPADNVLFWPIGQDVFAYLVRALLDRAEQESADPSQIPDKARLEEALKPLGKMDWRLHAPPWRGLLLTWDRTSESWSMRSEDRKSGVDLGKQVARWVLGIDDLDDTTLKTLQFRWKGTLISHPDDDEDGLWKELLPLRQRCAT